MNPLLRFVTIDIFLLCYIDLLHKYLSSVSSETLLIIPGFVKSRTRLFCLSLLFFTNSTSLNTFN